MTGEYLRTTELAWTILGPGRLTEDRPSGRITVGRDAGRPGRETSRGNVALVAAAVLGAPGTVHRTIRFVDGAMPICEAVTDPA